MTSDTLYRVKKEDFPKLEQLLIKCFEKDPLYVSMIPDEDIRKRLMPELFKCDLNEFYETCEIFADSEEINGILVVSDEAEPYNLVHFYLSEDGRISFEGGSVYENSEEFYYRKRLPQFELDGSASPE